MEFDGEAYRHKNYTENISQCPDGSTTLLEIAINRCYRQLDQDVFGTIQHEELAWKTGEDFLSELAKISSYISSISTSKSNIGVYSVNRYEWMLAEHSTYATGNISCPLYSTFGVESVKFVLNQSEMSICFLSGDKASSLYTDILSKGHKTFLEHLIVFDSFPEEENILNLGIQVHHLKSILAKELNFELVNEFFAKKELFPSIDDISTICYTSGTSGMPKGAILTHRNFICNVSAFQIKCGQFSFYTISEKDVYMSYLPLTHVMERICVNVVLNLNAKIAFFRGSVKTLADDYKVIKPTFIAGVPRVFNVFKKTIEDEVHKKGIITQYVFKLAVKYKKFWQKWGYYTSFIDRFIFEKVKNAFGGRIKAALCGSAPINPENIRFLQACLGCKIFQGYGQTETTAASIVSPFQITDVDTVGIPFPSNRIKLQKLPDEERFEILVKGENVFKGYYKNEEETAKSFYNGWFVSGDLAIVENNLFKIVGRKKEIFKTAQGEYIVPEKIENILQCSIIDDIYVTGRTTEEYIIAIVVCLNNSTSDEEIVSKIKEVGEKAYLEKRISRFEIPRRIKVVREGFDSLGEVITTTNKKKRALMDKLLKNVLDEVYKTK